MNKVYVVGIGPGGAEQMTPQARAAMDRAEVLCGYTVYIDLVRSLYPGKEVFTTPMTREWERCRRCLELAQSGRTVAMLCSGEKAKSILKFATATSVSRNVAATRKQSLP